jgi:hypothetical protein
MIAEWLPLFFAPDDVLEIRVLDAGRLGRKVAGYLLAKNIPPMAKEITAAGDKASGIYFTPQRLDPLVLKRCPHVLVEVKKDETGRVYPKLTHDEDVTARRYLLIDVDPEKPAEARKLSATDAEKAAAWEVAGRTREYLTGLGWSAPIVVDSGNGYHLYYRLADVPGGPADTATDPIAALLRCLKARFDTDTAKIDPSVFNAARIMKVPGTVARKGEPTADRPHRPCSILEVPSDWHP